jgi:hypothetical protein
VKFEAKYPEFDITAVHKITKKKKEQWLIEDLYEFQEKPRVKAALYLS